jgi:site-specific recombinase XerD
LLAGTMIEKIDERKIATDFGLITSNSCPDPGGIIWYDLRRTFATRLRANGVHEYDISDLLGHSRPGVTRVYARATRVVLEQAVEKLTEPGGQIIEFERRAG